MLTTSSLLATQNAASTEDNTNNHLKADYIGSDESPASDSDLSNQLVVVRRTIAQLRAQETKLNAAFHKEKSSFKRLDYLRERLEKVQTHCERLEFWESHILQVQDERFEAALQQRENLLDKLFRDANVQAISEYYRACDWAKELGKSLDVDDDEDDEDDEDEREYWFVRYNKFNTWLINEMARENVENSEQDRLEFDKIWVLIKQLNAPIVDTLQQAVFEEPLTPLDNKEILRRHYQQKTKNAQKNRRK